MPFYVMPFCVMPVCVLPVCVLPLCVMPLCVLPFCVMPFCVLPLCVMPVSVLPLCVMPLCVLPFSAMPFSARLFSARLIVAFLSISSSYRGLSFTTFDSVYFRFDLTLFTFRLLNFVIDIPSYLYPVKHLWIYSNKQNGDWVRFGVVKLFLFRVRPKWVIRKYGVYYWTSDGKLREIMRLWKYFAVPKSSFFRLFKKHLTSQK